MLNKTKLSLITIALVNINTFGAARINQEVNDIVDAARVGDVALVEKLIKEGTYIDALDEHGYTALLAAAAVGQKETVRLLIDSKANVNAGDLFQQGGKPLITAAANGKKNIVELLISAKADVNAADSNGNTALILASGYGNKDTDILKLLIDARADINASDVNKCTALMKASYLGQYYDIMQLLISHNADVNTIDIKESTPLIEVSSSGRQDLVKLLLINGADLLLKDEQKALAVAKRYRNDESIKLLEEEPTRRKLLSKYEKIMLEKIRKHLDHPGLAELVKNCLPKEFIYLEQIKKEIVAEYRRAVSEQIINHLGLPAVIELVNTYLPDEYFLEQIESSNKDLIKINK